MSESTTEKSCKVSLKDVTAFLSKQGDENDTASSVEERTGYAISLLQALPCARYAVLEKIGDVFFDEAQQYVVDLERQHLAGMPPISEQTDSHHDTQIKKIQQVLISSIQSNSNAWAPVIFQWAVQTCSQISGQYGTNRHFSTLTVHQRLQMWLACSATNNLMDIIICCLNKIIHKNQESCLKYLLNATLAQTPFFNWALAHICCAFPDIVPEILLRHALEAFSKQSRKAEVIKETMLSIFELIIPKKEKCIQDAIHKLFISSLVEVTENSKADDHSTLCVIPFLLHLAVNRADLFVPIVDKVLDTLTVDHLSILFEQSKLREDVLQRGIIRRTVSCLKMINGCTYKILQYLIKYSCMEDTQLCKDHPDLAKSVQNVSFVMLESLLLTLKHEVHVYAHDMRDDVKVKGEEPEKIPFLSSLSTYTRQCCCLLTSPAGTKKEILQDFIILMAIQEGREKMKEIVEFILVNTTMGSNKSTLKTCVNEFELLEENLLNESLDDIFQGILVSSRLSTRQISTLLQNLAYLLENEKDEGESFLFGDRIKNYVSTIGNLLVACDDLISLKDAFRVIKILCSKDLRPSEYALIVQATIHIYFQKVQHFLSKEASQDLKDVCSVLQLCEEVLVYMATNQKSLQQFIIRLLIEGMVKKKEESFTTEPEEPCVKVELMDKNSRMAEGIHNNVTSILFKDGLKLNKRKIESSNEENDAYMRQYFMATLFAVLSINTTPRQDDDDHKDTFFTTWGDLKFSRPFPSAYAYTANLLVELVCPESVPVSPWPDENFLKYTIERDLKVKNSFDEQQLYWDILELVSTARPSLYQCSVLIQSLFGMSLKFWQSNRRPTTTSTPNELKTINRLLLILKQAGWLPNEFDSISDIFPYIKPKEVYNILSAIWKYLKLSSFSPERFIDRDSLGRPQPTPNPEHLLVVRSVIKIVFFQNISKIGHMCNRFCNAMDSGIISSTRSSTPPIPPDVHLVSNEWLKT